jgi:hypothetical protein
MQNAHIISLPSTVDRTAGGARTEKSDDMQLGVNPKVRRAFPSRPTFAFFGADEPISHGQPVFSGEW